MLMWFLAKARMAGAPRQAASATRSAARIRVAALMRPPLPARSVEHVRHVESDDVLTAGELGDRDGSGARVHRPRAVLGEDVTVSRLVVPVLQLTVEMLGDQVLSRHRELVERLVDPGARTSVILEPLAAEGARGAVGEVVVRDPGEALPKGVAPADGGAVLAAVIVVEEERQRRGRLDRGDEVSDLALVPEVAGLLGAADGVAGERQLVVHRVRDVPDPAPAVVVARDLVPALDRPAGDR